MTAWSIALRPWQDPNLAALADRQKLLAVLLAVAVLGTVLELVRRRKLREEYSWMWVVTACLLMVLALNQDLILVLSGWIGSATATSTLFTGCLLFLLIVALQFSVRLSRLTQRHKSLGQRIALLQAELDQLRQKMPPSDEPVPMHKPSTRAEPAQRQADGAA
jgi:hypothetical protein